MATRLRLHFQGQRLALLLKAVVFFVTLWFAASRGGEWLPLLCFVLAALSVYFTPFENVKPYRASFLTLVAVSVIAVLGGVPVSWFIVPTTLTAYGIFGLKSRYFISRIRIQYFITLALTYGSFFLFFTSDRSQWFVVKLVIALGALFLIWREFFSTRTIFGLLLALIAIEVAWVASLLPMSGINAANLSFLAAFVLGDTLQKKAEGTLSRNTMLVGATIAVFGTIVIFATS